MKRNVILWMLVPICNVLYQFFIKLVARHMDGIEFGSLWLQHAAISPWMWLALISEIGAFFVWMQILSTHNLSKAFPLSAISYLLVLCVGWFVFHEPIMPLQLLGSALIMGGVWFIATAEAHS